MPKLKLSILMKYKQNVTMLKGIHFGLNMLMSHCKNYFNQYIYHFIHNYVFVGL